MADTVGSGNASGRTVGSGQWTDPAEVAAHSAVDTDLFLVAIINLHRLVRVVSQHYFDPSFQDERCGRMWEYKMRVPGRVVQLRQASSNGSASSPALSREKWPLVHW